MGNSGMSTSDTPPFSWLHLTDLHQGMGSQDWLWPSVREAFFDDLARLHERCGPWDVVFFTGDLTQRGSAEEFAALDETLTELWRHLESLGSTPALLCVPGNHDLIRPAHLSSTHRILVRWGDNEDAHADLWQVPDSEYRAAITKVFAPFSAWWSKRCAKLPQGWSYREGVLPGDWSLDIPHGERRVGVVGLNSSYVQLDDSDFEGRIHLDTRQFNAACEGDGPRWARDKDLCFLLTHHGPEWLSPAALDHLRGNIDVPPRFTAHLYGHMHGHAQYVTAEGGGRARRRWQGSSMFGLEWFRGRVERAHGYAGGRVEFERAAAELRTWPRSASKKQGGYWKLNADPGMDLEDDGGTRPVSLDLRPLGPPAPATGAATSGEDDPRYATALAAAADHFGKIEAYKSLHDAFHNIEFVCYRPLLTGPSLPQLRAAHHSLRSISKDIEAQLRKHAGQVDKVLATVITMQLDRAVAQLGALKTELESAEGPARKAALDKAIEELHALLGQLPGDLERQLSEATKAMHQDRQFEGVPALEQLRADLEDRVEEHSWLQRIDGELRSPHAAPAYHWAQVKAMLAMLEPVSTPLREAWKDIEASTREVDRAFAEKADVTGALTYYHQLIAEVFRYVDAELKDKLAGLVEPQTPLMEARG
jgi:hypothetical protein